MATKQRGWHGLALFFAPSAAERGFALVSVLRSNVRGIQQMTSLPTTQVSFTNELVLLLACLYFGMSWGPEIEGTFKAAQRSS